MRPFSVTVTAPIDTCRGRRTTARMAVVFVFRSSPENAQRAVPRMKKPATIATRRWNHSMNEGIVCGRRPLSHSGHCAEQASPEPVAAV
jgi:hypothetical protein